MKVVTEISLSKEIRIWNNTQEWFDRDIAEFIRARVKLFLKFKKSKPHIDQKIYKVKYQVWNLIRKKKRESYETNVRSSRP